MAAEEARNYVMIHQGTPTVLGVRQPKECEPGYISGNRHIPLPEVPERLGKLKPELSAIVYCAIGVCHSTSGCCL